MTDSPQPATASGPKGSFGSIKKPYLIGAVVLVIFIGVAAIFGPALARNIQLMNEFSDAYIYKSNGESGDLYTFGLFGISPVRTGDGEITGYAKGDAAEVVVIRYPDSTRIDLVSGGVEGRVIISNDEVKESLSVSPDGEWVAYAVLTGEASGELASWTVRASRIADGEMVEFGPGYGPQFFTKNGEDLLFFTAPEGIAVVDLETRTGFTTTFPTGDTLEYPLIVSPDGSYVLQRDERTGDYFVFTLEALEPFATLNPVGTLPGTLRAPAFRNGSLYGFEPSDEGVALVRIIPTDLTSRETRYVFTDTSFDYRLIP